MTLRTPDGDTVLQPDLVIARRDRLTTTGHDGPPVLAVEVLSPTTWHRDLGVKMATYARAGVRHYWVVAGDVPSVTVYELDAQGSYGERSHGVGDQPVRVTAPVEVTLRASNLIPPAGPSGAP